MSKIFHPLLGLIASATDCELAKNLEYLKHENKLLGARLPKQVHTTYEERQTLLKYCKAIWLPMGMPRCRSPGVNRSSSGNQSDRTTHQTSDRGRRLRARFASRCTFSRTDEANVLFASLVIVGFSAAIGLESRLVYIFPESTVRLHAALATTHNHSYPAAC